MRAKAEQQRCWWVLLSCLLLATYGCTSADPSAGSSGSTSGVGGWVTGGSGPGGGGTGLGGGGAGGGGSTLEALLEALRTDLDGTLQAQSELTGWPVPVEDGLLFVSTDPALSRLAGDHNDWTGAAMNADAGFHWLVAQAAPGSRYKLTDSVNQWQADPWSRAYDYDENGEISLVAPAAATHLERYFAVGSAALAPRTVRVWLPEGGVATHVLYAHDGQNLFDPEAAWGGWQLQLSIPPQMMVVGIDNTPDRMDEYTHVPDWIGELVGGQGDAYADFVQTQVRGLIEQHYGEPPTVGTLGSSLGGLVSFHIAQRYPGAYSFAASLSGTMGWGSIGLSDGQQNETMIERYQAAGHGSTALYLDSGGGGTCFDSDGDGIEDDDPDAADNYCENKQLESVLYSVGYVSGQDMWHWWEPDAPHNEAAWAARVWRPLEIFAGL